MFGHLRGGLSDHADFAGNRAFEDDGGYRQPITPSRGPPRTNPSANGADVTHSSGNGAMRAVQYGYQPNVKTVFFCAEARGGGGYEKLPFVLFGGRGRVGLQTN